MGVCRVNLILAFLTALLCVTACGRSEVRSYQGYVEGENIYLTSPFQGKLVQKLVERGQRVKQGQLLFVLDPNPENITVSQNKAQIQEELSTLHDLEKPKRPPEIDAIEDQIKQADASLALAVLRVKRYQQLYQQKAVELDRVDEVSSTQRIDEAVRAQYQANLALAKMGARPDQIEAQKAKITQTYAKHAIAEWQLAQKSIYAPTKGVIFDTYFELGEFVEAVRPIAALLPDKQIRIEFFVPAVVLTRIHLNKKIQVSCDGCQRAADAQIIYISPEAEYVPPLVYSRENEDNLVFRIKAHVAHPTTFKPGQPVRVLLELDHV